MMAGSLLVSIARERVLMAGVLVGVYSKRKCFDGWDPCWCP